MSNKESLEPVEVIRIHRLRHPNGLGPLNGFRLGDALAYEYEWEVPQPFQAGGSVRLERVFVLLDVGVSFADFSWFSGEQGSWYVDLLSVSREGSRYVLTDLYVDAILTSDFRHRLTDLDEIGDAVQRGELALDDVVDGVRRWQKFLNKYLYGKSLPTASWADFPPAAVAPLRDLEGPFVAA